MARVPFWGKNPSPGARYRRTRIGAAVVVATVATTVTTTWVTSGQGGAVATGGVAGPPPGEGSASAQTAQVLPKAGSLSIGVTLGESLAGHQNYQAKAQSQAIDLGAIGTSLTGYNCGQNPQFQPSQLPQALMVESGDKNAATGITETEEGGAFSKFGKADVSPYSEAITTSAPFAIAGLVEVGAGVARTWSGVVDGQRVAGASSDITGITLPGGVRLASLHWQAEYWSTGGHQPSGTFSVGQVTAPGAPAANPLAGLAALNALLGPLGLRLDVPVIHQTSGILYVDPLRLTVVPNATRDGLLNTILSGIQPIRQPVIDAVLKAYCQADTELTVADVAIGSISGAGSLEVALGGVQATSGAIQGNRFNLGLPGVTPPPLADHITSEPSLTPAPAFRSDSAAAPIALGPPAGSPPASSNEPSERATLPPAATIAPISITHGKRGGALAAVGLAGLALLAVLAEADRRKMRHAQRLPTSED